MRRLLILFIGLTSSLLISFFAIPNSVEAVSIANNQASESKEIKLSKDFAKMFCNSIGFGISKDSAMMATVDVKAKQFASKGKREGIDKELTREALAIEIIERCGDPLGLYGESGANQMETYLSEKNSLTFLDHD